MDFGNRIVFIGDSITEWGRFEDTEGIGTGYVRILHDYLRVTYPEKNYEIINRGIGGDRIINLEDRWQKDVLDLKPTTVSISIGINDVWRQLDQPNIEQVYPEQFEEKYRNLLLKLKQELNPTIILMDPTVIEEDINSKGNQALKPYVAVVEKLAKEFDAIRVTTHEAFINYLKKKSGYLLTTDGVHMNSAGNMLMAQTWINEVEK
ncbi:SGNH/GDSL hydrolase family protein [Saliterribacillus persicus]|uniref:Lysophospholipase L1-like esterase n=1 Tax=Saliterribacillus persicus TaxID=930114 RepID=A0A368Y3F2_9BACI|nr:SGNH/GDSL hydrolase family protein [Saliterribacillus persicus]RCW74830.1 lysophospholipase L1-like esterase [Saliterribacillus persicus]